MAEINFGFLLIPLQLLDLAGPLDVLSNASKQIMSAYGWDDEMKAGGVDIKFHHIGPDMKPVQLTGGFLGQPTTTIKECPKLDYLLVGGPDISYIQNVPQEMADFIRERSKEVKTLFTTCTGALVVAATGILDGKKATVNHAVVPMAKQFFPNVEWTDQANWVADGKFMTAAGAIAGTDMMANWVRDNFGKTEYHFSTCLLEYQPRDVNAKFIESMNGRTEIVPGA